MPSPRWLVSTGNPAEQVDVPVVQPRAPDPVPDVLVAVVQPPEPVLSPEQKVVYAFLNPGGGIVASTTANTLSEDPPYVIIGCGFAATVNHATLLQSEWGLKRVGRKRIVHIGYPDPWRNYHPHNMNQEIELLALPGYAAAPGGSDARVNGERPERWLKSESFASINSSEFAKLADDEGSSHADGEKQGVVRAYVTNIVEFGEKNYELKLHTGEKLVAAYVDICSGPGQSRASGRNEQASPDLLEEIRTLQAPDVDWFPRYVTANNITLENAKVAKGGLILVKGSGPAAVQAIERALEVAELADQILWVSKDINGGFPGTLRLDGMVNLENGSSLPIRTGFPDSKALLRPASPRVWLADGYDVDSIVSITPGIVAANPDWPDLAGRVREGTIARPTMLVKFKQDRDPAFERTDRGPSCRGDAGDKDVAAPLVWGIFHQVIAANGVQATGWDRPEAGSPYAFAASLKGGSAILHAPLCGGDSTIPVGRHHNSERLRWLASSGHGNWLVIAKSDAPSLALKEYQDRLPAQAIINLQGVTVSAVTVAYANRWFLGYHKHPRRPFNTNINTVPLEELVLAAKWNGKPSTWAANIVKMRTLRTRPFQSLEQVARASVYRSFNEPREVVSDAAIAEACLGRESQVNEELAVLTRAGFTIPYLPGEPSARAY